MKNIHEKLQASTPTAGAATASAPAAAPPPARLRPAGCASCSAGPLSTAVRSSDLVVSLIRAPRARRLPRSPPPAARVRR